MKVLRLTVIVGIIVLFTSSLFAFSTGDLQKGQALFRDEGFAGATRGRSCNSCHINGKGLEHAGNRTGWTIMGKRCKNLEDAVNYMIEKGLHGKAIDPRSEEMVHIVAYIKSL